MTAIMVGRTNERAEGGGNARTIIIWEQFGLRKSFILNFLVKKLTAGRRVQETESDGWIVRGCP